jgi:hypothetical protein
MPKRRMERLIFKRFAVVAFLKLQQIFGPVCLLASWREATQWRLAWHIGQDHAATSQRLLRSRRLAAMANWSRRPAHSFGRRACNGGNFLTPARALSMVGAQRAVSRARGCA